MSSKSIFIVASSLLSTLSLAATTPDCPGVWATASAQPVLANGACCVAGNIPDPINSVCAGWPRCTGSTTIFPTSTPISCATVIPSASDYSAELAKATSSLAASGTKFATTLTGPYCAQQTSGLDSKAQCIGANANSPGNGASGSSAASGSSRASGSARASGSSGSQTGSSSSPSGTANASQVSSAASATATSGQGSGAISGYNLDLMLVAFGSIFGVAMGGAAFWL